MLVKKWLRIQLWIDILASGYSIKYDLPTICEGRIFYDFFMFGGMCKLVYKHVNLKCLHVYFDVHNQRLRVNKVVYMLI